MEKPQRQNDIRLIPEVEKLIWKTLINVFISGQIIIQAPKTKAHWLPKV